ncbi:MAG: alpha/beta hydrolase [Gaiellaceae bacterium]
MCVDGGSPLEKPGDWSATLEWLVRRLAPRLPGLGFVEVRYRIKSWVRLDDCIEDAQAGIAAALDGGARELALLGFSFGGGISTLIAGHPSVTTVIGLAPLLPADIDLSGVEGRRVALIHGGLDRPFLGIPGVRPELTLRCYRRMLERGVDATYTRIPGAVHGVALRAPGGGMVALPRARRWLDAVAAELERFAQ